MSYKKMVRYEILKKTDLLPLVATGIVSVYIANWLDIYEWYLKNQYGGCKKPQAIKNCAVHWNVSDRLIYKIINYMET